MSVYPGVKASFVQYGVSSNFDSYYDFFNLLHFDTMIKIIPIIYFLKDQLSQLQRSLSAAENERKVLEDRLESSRLESSDLKRNQEMLQDKISQLQSALQKSESRANQCEIGLQSSRAQLVRQTIFKLD
jgi:hypothetical protein